MDTSSLAKQYSGATSPSLGNKSAPTPRPASATRHELQQDFDMGALNGQAVLGWDLPSPWSPSHMDLNFGTERSPNQVHGPLPTGLTEFIWDDFPPPDPFGSMGHELGPTHSGIEHSRRTPEPETVAHEKRLPWVSPGTTLDDMFQILASSSGPHWCREVPNLTQSDAHQYWNSYFEEFHKVRHPIVFESFWL
jgi:hypothetical protein